MNFRRENLRRIAADLKTDILHIEIASHRARRHDLSMCFMAKLEELLTAARSELKNIEEFETDVLD
jgi:hypothetical protein